MPDHQAVAPRATCHITHYFLQVIDLGDSMTFDPIPGQADSLTCNVQDIPLDDSNLVIKVHQQPA